MSELRLELLLGKKVVDVDGRKAGRIEDLRTFDEGDRCVITHFMIGRRMARLTIGGIGSALLARLGAKAAGARAVRWHLVDLSDPEHPRLLCRASDLDENQQHPEGR